MVTTTRGDVALQGHPKLLRASTTFYDRVVTDWWWWELLSWTVSFSCVAAIVGVLWYYDGRRQPEFVVTGITLNTYVAIFSAVAKAAMILPVSEAIGQLKWIWFQDDAALWDFQLFDGASRGPWGSVVLLIKSRCKHLVSLGASVTILALAFEPFFQQILTYPARTVPVGQSMVWAATTYLPTSPPRLRIVSDAIRDPSMAAAIDTAFNIEGIEIKSANSRCPTGECTWPVYSTLGVCHQCQDLSHIPQYICENHTTLDGPSSGASIDPCGFKVNNTLIVGSSGNPGFRTVRSLSTIIVDTFNTSSLFEPFLNTTVFANATLPIANFYVGYTPGGPEAVLRNQTPIFIECLLTWCARTLESRFTNGLLQEKIVDTITIQPSTSDLNAYSPIIATLGSNMTFNIRNLTTQSLRDRIISNLPPALNQDPKFAFGSDAGIWQFHQEAPYKFEPHLANVANAITNDMRSRAFGAMRIEGVSWSSERFVSVRWVWITLPATLLMGSLVLICSTILKSRRSGALIWKSSSLATLLHGLSENTQRSFDSGMSTSQIETASMKMKVQLSSREGDARLVAI